MNSFYEQPGEWWPRIKRGSTGSAESKDARSCHAKSSSVLSTPPMVRRVASQVHKQASRLLKAGYLKREPAWFQAVLEHPPLPLPARAPPSRSEFDLPLSPKKPADIAERPLDIAYLEDGLRKQFFRDHPFEAFRPTSLVEGREIEDEHPVRGKAWTRLRQRTRNPKPEECAYIASCLGFVDVDF